MLTDVSPKTFISRTSISENITEMKGCRAVCVCVCVCEQESKSELGRNFSEQSGKKNVKQFQKKQSPAT